MKLKIVFALLGLAAIPQARGQSKPPNLEAHRMYFVAVTSSIDKDVDTAALAIRSYLNTAGVAESEHGAAFQALAKFKNRYAALTEAYNNSPSTLAGNNDDTALFLTQRDMLVQNTIELLQASLSERSFKNLTERVRHDSLYIRNVGIVEPAAKHQHRTEILPVQNGMTPHYSASRSSSLSCDVNSNCTWYETDVVDGYTSCSYCPYQHWGVVHNTLNNGTDVIGPRVPAPSNISVSNQQQGYFLSSCFDAIFPEACNLDFEEEAKIQCQSVGTIFWWVSIPFRIRLEGATTLSKNVADTPPADPLVDWCKLQYEPPDYNPDWDLNSPPGMQSVRAIAVCENSTWNSNTWVCSTGVSWAYYTIGIRGYCTHNKPPY